MNNAVVRLPEKRPNSDYDNMPEKRIEDTSHTASKDDTAGNSTKCLKSAAMKLQFCMTCGCNTYHSGRECPNYATGRGMACYTCREPCEIKEHQDRWKVLLKVCFRCDASGKHWSKDCPSPIYDDCDDMYF